MKDALFTALLTHVPFDGWSDAALRAAAKDVGVDFDMAQSIFPSALAMIEHHHRLTDAAMVVPADGGITVKIRAAILSRLAFMDDDREAVRRAASTLALPPNLLASTRLAYQSADAIWRAAGSDDQGFDWMTKRTSLIAVYSATLLYWMEGRDPADVAAYLDTQLARLLRVMKPIGQLKARVMGAFTPSS